jgi:hypothetical protein
LKEARNVIIHVYTFDFIVGDVVYQFAGPTIGQVVGT